MSFLIYLCVRILFKDEPLDIDILRWVIKKIYTQQREYSQHTEWNT